MIEKLSPEARTMLSDFLNQIDYEKDKEIERLKEVINGMIENEEKYNLEIIKLKSIIKEVREYIGSKEHYEDDFDTEIKKVYKILDKENKDGER